MAKSDARFEYRSKLSRTDHDLSQPFGFTTAPGMLNPIWMDYATPGDSYYIKHDLSFLRTSPLVAPAMIDVLVHYETFFVPMQMIYQPFENSVYSIKPVLSSMFDPAQLTNMNLPTVDLYQVKGNFDTLGAAPRRSYFYRLLDLFEIYDKWVSTPIVNSGQPGNYVKKVFPMFPCAYQCIYQHYYRLDDKEEFTNIGYNLDRFYNTDIDNSNLNTFELRFRPWNFDYFTSSYRSPIVSSFNTQDVLPSGSYGDLVSATIRHITNTGALVNSNSNTRAFASLASTTYTPNTLQASLSTAAIRQMFANEKLSMITGRTKKNYDSQTLAHYGVQVPHDVKHDITLIGQDTYKLQIGEVTSLASTELSPLGEIAGKGWTMGKGKQHKFTAPCHGVIMTIFSVEPIRRYFNTTNRLNTVTSTVELPTPEFDRLGNQPMYDYEAGQGLNQDVNWNSVAAWKERFYYSKRRVPRVSKAFMHYSDKQDHSYTPNLNTYASYFISSAGFAVPSSTSNIPMPSTLSSYMIDPNAMDQLMLVPFVGNYQESETGENWTNYPYMMFARDPFIVDSDIKVKKVSWMSKDGEPIYPY